MFKYRVRFLARSQEHELWVLDVFLELLSPHGCYSTIDDSMVRAQGDVHYLSNLELIFWASGVLVNNDTFLGSRYSEDTGLWWVNDSREVMYTEHTKVGNSESATGQFIWLEFVLSSSSSNVLNLSCNLVQSLKVCILDNWGHQSMVSLYSNTHVNVLELAHEIVHPGRVCLWDVGGSKRSSFNDHIID